MTTRRGALAGGAAVALALSAGCLGFVRGRDALEFGAGRVVASDDVLSDAGYEQLQSDQHAHEETVDVGVEREVRATYWVSVYAKEMEVLGVRREAATFAAVSSPALEVFGRSLNPLMEKDRKELLAEIEARFENSYGELRDLRREETIHLPILGEARDVDRFVGTTTVAGDDVDLVFLLTTFEYEDDYVVLLGGHPEPLPDEGVNIELLMESVEYEP